MANKDLNSKSKTKKEEMLIKDIDELEKQITEVQDKLHILENEEKLESYKRNFLEVEKDNSRSDIQFYEEYLKKMESKVMKKQTVYLTFSAKDEYYDKLLGIFREQHLLDGNSGCPEEISFSESNPYFKKEIQNLQKQIETSASAVEEDSAIIQQLLEDLYTVS